VGCSNREARKRPARRHSRNRPFFLPFFGFSRRPNLTTGLMAIGTRSWIFLVLGNEPLFFLLCDSSVSLEKQSLKDPFRLQYLFFVSNRGLYSTRGFLAVRHLQLRRARLPDTCTIRTASSVRARRASLHLIQWALWATNASAAPLLCHRTAIKITECGPIFCIGPHFVPNQDIKKVSFKDCFSYEVRPCLYYTAFGERWFT